MLRSFTNRVGRSQCLPSISALVVSVVTSAATVFAVPPDNPVTPAPATVDFPKDIRPVLEAACFTCHNEKQKKGDVDFTFVTDGKLALRHKKLWRKAIQQIEAGEMPPQDERPLSAEEKITLLRWMKSIVTADISGRDPGPYQIRCMNRAEYNLTIRDLFGIDVNVGDAVGMPDDIPVQGFSTLANALTLPPAMIDKYFAAAERALDEVLSPDTAVPNTKPSPAKKAQMAKARDAIYFAKVEGDVTKEAAAKQILDRFASQAFRRPIQKEESEKLLKLFSIADAKGDSFDNAVRLPLKAILVSPKFLFRIEQESKTKNSGQAYRINDFELATRMSYFLWSTMPDSELAELAGQNKLSDPTVLEKQVQRMLASPKAKALTDNFANQWLQIRKLNEARPSSEFFPTFTGKLRKAMYDETTMFFDRLRLDDRSILDLLDADYTYVNDDLAKHYGLPEVKGGEMRKVDLTTSDHRGGLLGMASVLTMTSHTSRTSPTLRGKYVLEVIFNDPPPPPPANAGMLKEEKKGKEAKSFREQLAQHAANATCASCHKRVDPLGFALENFDAVGRWRDDNGGRPLDNSGQLSTGESFTGPAGLKKLVQDRKEQFVRGLIERMFSYALGRELDWYDEGSVNEVKVALEKNDYRFSVLMTEVIKSYPFQYRKNMAADVDHDR